MSTHENDLVEARLFRDLCVAVDSPRSLAAWLCYKHDHNELLKLRWAASPLQTEDVNRLDYFITEYLSKYKGLRTGIDTAKVALGKWLLAEQRCKDTNLRLRTLAPGFNPRVDGLLFAATRKIANVLGPWNFRKCIAECRWGSGATVDIRRADASIGTKQSTTLTVTAAALPWLKAFLESDPHWFASLTGHLPSGPFSVLSDVFKIVRGNKFQTVPKNAKTDRCIAAEPTGNGFLQQGVGRYIRHRLKRFGVDLDDQSRNQLGAQQAYQEGFATLDLSSASDTISRELVYQLLPVDWWLYLDALRSPFTSVDGEWVRLEKFASMGNAFTFELESLIFWALCKSVEELSSPGVDNVTVYGDDLIVNSRDYTPVCEILSFCGFEVNPDKSFSSGEFFESCGRHYYRGQDVTPVYQKEIFDTPSELIRASNRLWRFARSMGLGGFTRFASAIRSLEREYPLRPLPRIPSGCAEDGGFLTWVKDLPLPDPNHGFRCHVLDYTPRYAEDSESGWYSNKLRRFKTANALPKGHVAKAMQGKWRSKVRYISLAAGLGDPAIPPSQWLPS